MFFTESERLAERHPDLEGAIQQIDAQLVKMPEDGVIRASDLASFLGADPNQVGSVLDMLVQEKVLRSEEMVECPHCQMATLRADYEKAIEEEDEYTCTGCDQPMPRSAANAITTYRCGERWKNATMTPENSELDWTFAEQGDETRARNESLCHEYAAMGEQDLLAVSTRWRDMAVGFTAATKRTGHYHGCIVHDDGVQRVTKILETAVSQRGIEGVSRLGRCLRRPDDNHLHWALATLDELDAKLRVESLVGGIVASGAKQPTSFTITDYIGTRTLTIPADELAWSGDPVPVVLETEAATNTRLRDGENPIWFLRVHHQFKEKTGASDVSFADYVKRLPLFGSRIDVVSPTTASVLPAGTGSKALPWVDDAEGYVPNSQAIKLAGEAMKLPALSKLLTPDGHIRHMRKGRRCKVHVNDFLSYLKGHSKGVTDKDLEQMAERFREVTASKLRPGK